jgi:PKD repeat protein
VKNIFFKITLLLVISSGLGSCKKEQEEKIIADFTYTTIPNGGIEVSFTGNGNAYWDFGGPGIKVGSGKTVKYYYENDGNYVVTLTSKNSAGTKNEGKSQSISISGVPTKVKITAIKLTNFRPTNSSGNLWNNDDTGPDVKFTFSSIVGNEDLTNTYPNLTTNELPLFVSLTIPKIFNLSGEGSLFSVYCYDDTYTTEAIEKVDVSIINITAKASCSDACGITIYPQYFTSNSFYNNFGRIELTLEWLP